MNEAQGLWAVWLKGQPATARDPQEFERYLREDAAGSDAGNGIDLARIIEETQGERGVRT